MAVRGYQQAQDRADLRAGTIAAQIINVNLGKGKEPWTAAHFFPHLRRHPAQEPDGAALDILAPGERVV
jgi:hypothetical protein